MGAFHITGRTDNGYRVSLWLLVLDLYLLCCNPLSRLLSTSVDLIPSSISSIPWLQDILSSTAVNSRSACGLHMHPWQYNNDAFIRAGLTKPLQLRRLDR